MENFTYYSPTRFLFGRGKEQDTGRCIGDFGGKKVLLHYGGGSVVESGLLERVRESIKAEGIECVELGGVKPNPRSGLVYEGIELCRREKIDFILALGGGSVIDSAKAIAAGAMYEGDFWDFYSGKSVVEKAIPLGTVLTIAAAGSESSSASVISLETGEGMVKRSTMSDALRPKFSIMNPELTFTLPPYQTASGIVDMMAHVMERYFTNTRGVGVTDRLCEGTMISIIEEAPKVMENPRDYEARANIMWAGTMAHNNICGVGRQQDWASHGLEHELSALYDCAHGAGLSVIFPAWMEHVMSHDVMRFAQFANRIFGCEMDFENPEVTAKRGIESLKSFWKSIGMPISFEEIGAKSEDIPLLLDMLDLENRNLGVFVELTREDCEAIYRIASR
ncbi:NADH-dependent butanol dehydrogenase A [Andreesenia angusta]|uniref:NADH-dependent butanol dehydrogenase A n=1 Tax=Andreesenia angusta TaxID=39480 RepID=A0A1S1V9K4_9FIRM|nr:iron-containing alcohol dehydrogenase [Andreesenia angusta]OHW63293.1 NADH-dependent butanol dehydrogenase A [Andreesenia angusta]